MKSKKPLAVGRKTARANVKGEQSRQTILDLAERHFGALGYRGVSTNAIAQDAGISDAGLLHHFSSKEGLLIALLNRRYSVDNDKLRMGERLGLPGLMAMLEQIVAENTEQRDQVQLTMVLLAESISTEHPAHEYFEMRYARARATMAKHMRNLQRDGVLGDDVEPEAMSSLIIAVLDGLQLQWLLEPSVTMADPIKCFVMLLDKALRAR